MSQPKINQRSDNQYQVEQLEPRRFLSVAADGSAPAEEAPPTEETYSSGSWGDGSDSAPVDDSDTAGDGEVTTDHVLNYGGAIEGDETGVTEDGNIICYMTGEVVGAVRTQHPLNPEASQGSSNNASPPPAQTAGFAKAADVGAVSKSVLGSSSGSVLS